VEIHAAGSLSVFLNKQTLDLPKTWFSFLKLHQLSEKLNTHNTYSTTQKYPKVSNFLQIVTAFFQRKYKVKDI